MLDSILKLPKLLPILLMLVFFPFTSSLNIMPANADPLWDDKGMIHPSNNASVRTLAHAKIKLEHKNIPLYRHANAKVHKEQGIQKLATLVDSQNVVSSQNMNGLNYDNLTPPDVQVAAGPVNIMEMTNLEGQIWTKSGSVQQGPFDLASFFGTGSDMISDPKLLFDKQSGRWFSSITDVSTSNVIVAVSTTNNAMGGYCTYSISGPQSTILDQPIIGTSNDKFVVSVNDFNMYTSQFTGAQFWVLNKGDMLNCSDAGYVTKTFTNYFSIHPVQSDTSTSVQYMVSTSQDNRGSYVNLFSIHGVPPSPVSFSVKDLKVSPIADPPSAIQKGSFLRLDTGDSRIQDAVWTGGMLWLAHNNSCVPAGDTVSRSCLHLVQVDTSTMSLKQDFNYGVADKYLFYPALREIPTTGSLMLVFGFSSSSDYPGIEITKQASSDPANSLEKPILMKAGNAPVNLLFSCIGNGNIACRYGDYFGAGLDPADASKVWVAGEYGTGARDYLDPGTVWGTSIASLTG